MGVSNLVGKYVVDIDCPHCGGTGKCDCSSCQHEFFNRARLVANVGSGMRPPLHEYDSISWKLYVLKRKDNIEKMEDAAKETIRRKVCATCNGKGKVGRVDYAKLDKEISDGIITRHQKSAIIQELSGVRDISYFQK